MKAIRQYKFGGPQTLVLEEVDAPAPGPNEVVISVSASGVHLLDTVIRRGEAAGLPHPLPDLPMTPGREVAGVVESVGADVSSEWVGKLVVAHLGFASGGYATKAVRDVTAVHEIPPGVKPEQAIAAIGTGRTTLMVLHSAQATSDDVVIVPAAAGGIGSLAVQSLKRESGATVIGLAGSPDKIDQVRRLGADMAVDYRKSSWPEEVRSWLGERSVTHVFDGVGGSVGRQALELLAPGGRHLIFGWSSGAKTAVDSDDIVERGLTVSSELGLHLITALGGMRVLEERSLAKVGAGVWEPLVHTFDLAEAEKAHRALENRETMGKVVLVSDSHRD